MGHDHERAVEPFSDVHCEEGRVRATLLHDPTVEGLDMALYMDGSGSMSEEYERKTKHKSFWSWLSGELPEILPNQVEPQVRWMLGYLATKDRNGLLRVAYWACGENGDRIELIGEIKGSEADSHKFGGPKHMGRQTRLAPALRDYIEYMRGAVKHGARQGCAVFVTDGEIHDADEVENLCRGYARDIVTGRLPRMNFILVGVGDAVNEEQMEHICHEEYPGVGHLWCHRIAEEIGQVAELVAVLVDETMTVAAGGTIYDDKGKVVRIYEARLPAVLEFEVYDGCTAFTLEVNGQRYTQPLPEEEHHGEEEEEHRAAH